MATVLSMAISKCHKRTSRCMYLFQRTETRDGSRRAERRQGTKRKDPTKRATDENFFFDFFFFEFFFFLKIFRCLKRC